MDPPAARLPLPDSPGRPLSPVASLLALFLAFPAAAEPPPAEPEQTEAAAEEQDAEDEQAAPRSHTETVVVTASRGEETIVDSVALVTALDSEDLADSPGVLVDEVLSRVPGFGLFRRNTSFISHPTTTGVSLRGIGPSGASRTLVLWDGVPLNDPFGNWVYWNRMPTLFLDRIEVARGAASPSMAVRHLAARCSSCRAVRNRGSCGRGGGSAASEFRMLSCLRRMRTRTFPSSVRRGS